MRLTEEDARARLTAARVARLATTGADGQPHLVPVTFAVDGELIYVAVDHKPKTTVNLRRLRNIRENPRVAVLADHYAPDWDTLWWVRVDGRASVTAADRGRLEEHLAGCPHCTEYLAQMRETIRLAGRLTPADLTPDMTSELTDLYRLWRAEG